MLRQWLVTPACLAGLALIAGCSASTGGQAQVVGNSTTLTSNSWGDLNLGDTAEDIRARHADFPAAGTGATLTWHDADLVFDAGSLVSIAPHSGGITDSGLTVDSSLDDARKAYGEPVSELAHVDGTATAIFLASAERRSGFRIELATPAGPVQSIALCNCLPDGVASPSGGAEGSTASSASPAPSTSPNSRASGPEKVVIRPVDAKGNLSEGFTTVPQSLSNTSIDCSFGGGTASPSAVDDDIFICSPNSAGAQACWPAAERGQALCLSNAFESTVVRWNTTEAMGTVSAPGDAAPIGLLLEDGQQCLLRNGGAWPPHESGRNLNGRYGCNSQIIWANTDNPIDKSNGEWTVLVGASDGPLQTLRVTKEYYVGTA